MMCLKHNRDKVGDFQKRALIHIPIGLLIGIPALGYPLLKLFIKYEENEDVHTQDEAWKDYFGAMIGASLTLIATIGFIVWLLI